MSDLYDMERIFRELGRDWSEEASGQYRESCRNLTADLKQLSVYCEDTSSTQNMLFDHNMVAKRCFYEEAACVPLILSGKPLESRRGTVEKKLAGLKDVMPTLLDLCGLPVPESVEGISLLSEEEHPYVYGEVGEGEKATRMVRWDRYKLIYYPCGNVMQLFDLEKDRGETHNCAGEREYQEVLERMKGYLVKELYGRDLDWIRDGELKGFEPGDYEGRPDYGLYNQRGYHWPVPQGYSNLGKNA